jgi:hypothetical protein
MDAKFEKSVNWGKVLPSMAEKIHEATERHTEVDTLVTLNEHPGGNATLWFRKVGLRVHGRVNLEDGTMLRGRLGLVEVRNLSKKRYVKAIEAVRPVNPARPVFG